MATLLVLAGLLGFAFGSFLTVVVNRIGTAETIVWGRSRCPHCRKELTWRELLPVVSFIAQGGRCRFCSKSISWQYPAIELATAGLFVLLAWGVMAQRLPITPVGNFFSGNSAALASFIAYAFFGIIALGIAAYDIAHQLIPRSFSDLLIGAGLVCTLALLIQGAWMEALAAMLAAGTGFFLFWAIWFLSRGRAMGRGDADIALGLGLFFGPGIALTGIVFSFWLGSLVGVFSILVQKSSLRTQIPFAPFLLMGALLALFFWPEILVVRLVWYGF